MSLVDKIFDKTIPGLSKTMDLTWRRNLALTSNISNAETPQYRAVDLNFAGELERAFQNSSKSLTQTHEQHLDISSQSQAHLVPVFSGATKQDGNNVDLDIQMGQLAHNSGRYSMAAGLMRKKLIMLRQAVREMAR